MVLLAAAICTKQGKALVSRQFVEMSRSRVEGLLAAFPKVMNTGKQHTFVETESVRYVYQPMEQLYMLLITTKASNILEDLETLRLFSRVIPEYCQSLDEYEVLDNAFELIFAFDEIIALGYRESVNLAQIRTFTEMDSHEERMFEAVRKSQERDAKETMKRKAKEMQQAKKEGRKGRGGFGSGFGGGMSSQDYSKSGYPSLETQSYDSVPKSTYSQPSRSLGTSAMKLGKKNKDIDSFVKKIESEGQRVTNITAPRQSGMVAKTTGPAIPQAPVHIKLSERASISSGRDSGLKSMEVLGMMTLKINEGGYGRINLSIANNEDRTVQFQTNPNIDKRLFNEQSLIGLKGEGRTFPIGQDISVLKWRFSSTDDSLIPLFINCWPSENAGSCDVNVEYELMQDYLELNNVLITIPVPSGVGAPVVGSVDGDHHYDSRKHVLEWCLPVIDSSNKNGTIEFSIPGHADNFFPIHVSFTSPQTYCHIAVSGVTQLEDNRPAKFSTETMFTTDKFEIV